MGDRTGIEWTDATWNPVRGCSIVSPGCTHCYAMKQAHRFSGPGGAYEGLTKLSKNGGPVWTGDVRTVPDLLDQPLRWKRPRMIFVDSMSDLFHEKVPDDFIDRVFAVMILAHRHTYQILTKRPDRMREYLSAPRVNERWSSHLAALDPSTNVAGVGENWLSRFAKHIWLGVSVEDQERADERVPILLETPAAVRWLSCEPLLGPVDLSRFMPIGGPLGGWYLARCEHCGFIGSTQYFAEDRGYDDADVVCRQCERSCRADEIDGLSWVVAGGESGPRSRPMHPAWVRSLRDQCKAAGVPFLFKQWGDWAPLNWAGNARDWMLLSRDGDLDIPDDRAPDSELGEVAIARLGKKRAGRELDGVIHDEYPQ